MDVRKWYNAYSVDCRLKYPSSKTHESYLSSVSSFLNYFKNEVEPKAISIDKIKAWLLGFLTINTRNHKLCAIKSFYQITVGMPLKLEKIPYAKRPQQLPVVLSVTEVQTMFNVCENKKHKVILALLYSCGLRVSELINLQWCHIDRSRMLINIIAAKGNKDRQVGLSPELIQLLEEYYHQYHSITYVLNGQIPDIEPMYSDRSVNEVLKQLARKAGIKKRVYAHLIRHCYATHLVEAGIDINLIQKLLGHSNVKTTNVYLHISGTHMSRIQSPLAAIKL